MFGTQDFERSITRSIGILEICIHPIKKSAGRSDFWRKTSTEVLATSAMERFSHDLIWVPNSPWNLSIEKVYKQWGAIGPGDLQAIFGTMETHEFRKQCWVHVAPEKVLGKISWKHETLGSYALLKMSGFSPKVKTPGLSNRKNACLLFLFPCFW